MACRGVLALLAELGVLVQAAHLMPQLPVGAFRAKGTSLTPGRVKRFAPH